MSWKVPFIDFPAQFQALESEIMTTIHDTLSRGDLVLRQQLRDFEANLASFVGTSESVGVANCTDGLRLTMYALGVGPGDEVITVSHTFIATISAIHHVGATPVLVDVGADHLMDPDAFEAAITPRTRGVIPVHLNGRLCNMRRIADIAGSAKLFVLEDSAQALGASYGGVLGGASGIGGTFSFYPAKMLGSYGDGGAVTTSDVALAEKLRLLRDHGRATKDDLACWAFNSRLDNLQAAILDLKLKCLPTWIARRREIATLYDKTLDGITDIGRPPPPAIEGPNYDVYQNYVIEADGREDLAIYLADRGIETLISLPIPNHKQSALGLDHFSLPRTEALSRTQISLPITTEHEDWQIEYVAETIRNFYGV